MAQAGRGAQAAQAGPGPAVWEGPGPAAMAAAERLAAERCKHQVLHEIDGIEGWYRCQNPECGWIFEFPVAMKAHTPEDIRRMCHWFLVELAR